MHPNDTLNGRLLAHEKPEERELRGKLGYWRMVEERMIRAELAKEGVEPTPDIIRQRVAANHRNDMSYRDYQEKVLFPRWRAQSRARFEAGETQREVPFTRPQLELILERFTGANDPEGQAIAEKVAAVLGFQ